MSTESVYYTIENLHNKHDIKEIKKELDAISGVISVSISQNSNLAVDYDNEDTRYNAIEEKLDELGYSFKTRVKS